MKPSRSVRIVQPERSSLLFGTAFCLVLALVLLLILLAPILGHQ
jgi:hypothetical protein